MEEEREIPKRETIVCPKDPAKRYFKKSCETIFRTSDFRPWCQECCHFMAATGKDNREKRTDPADE
jgi:hypothetical protein